MHRLEINEDGLHEEVEGVRSFAPWPCVLGYAHSNDVLLVRLKAGLWALVPRYGLLPGSADTEMLVDELKRKGIPNETRP